MGRNKKNMMKEIPHAIVDAMTVISKFPGVKIVGEPVQRKKCWGVITSFSVPLPSRAMKAGISLTGVKADEPVIFNFPLNYPRKAPTVLLRTDFPRNLPHINPGAENDFVAPCIYDGSLDDLLHQGLGLNEILNQVQDWLRKAASNTLINKRQGWEPIRYDSVEKFIVYEHAKLNLLVTDTADCKFLTCIGLEISDYARYKMFRYIPEVLNPRYLDIVTSSDEKKDGFFVNARPVLFAWSNKDVIVGEYFPETVTNLGELINKTKKYGTYEAFWSKIQSLWSQMRSNNNYKDIITIHCVRRPMHLINRQTDLEFLTYRVRAEFGLFGAAKNESPVDLVGHIHAVGPDVLKILSGSLPMKMDSIIQIGCGSLGSKIALHLARAGHGPLTLIDNKYMSEHNLARHALTKSSGNKSELLAKAIEELNVEASAYPKSVQDFLDKSASRLFEKNSLVIDSTASIGVREVLASLPSTTNNSRIFQTGLYAGGEMGYITIEGSGRNPRVDDLSAVIFDLAIDDKAISKPLNNSDDSFGRYSTGQGCGSYTMVIPDTKISMYSAAMAERARRCIEGNLIGDGEVLLGVMDVSGMSLSWNSYRLAKTKIVILDNKNWELRVLSPALEEMNKEAMKYSSVETGGVLIGRLCLTRKCAIVTRVLEAPPDSIRTSSRFELGIEGLKDKVIEIHKSSGLTYLGTWHSHLYGSSPSGIDDAMLRKVKSLRLGIPAFNLIWHNHELTSFADYGDYI
jgi:hypothetical protein